MLSSSTILSRREFLRLLGTTALVSSLDFSPPEYAVLADTTKCVGCRRCVAACKLENDLPLAKPEFIALNEELSPFTWTIVRSPEPDVFYKWQCLHCLDPSCARICPVEAITKLEEGPVVLDPELCIGCKYCIAACPFGIPRYNWATGKTYKCHFCYHRIAQGLEPACVHWCPVKALKFGHRDELVDMAETSGLYTYGIEEVGGTSWIYLTELPPKALGFPDVPLGLPLHVRLKEWIRPLTGLAIVAALGAACLQAILTRRKG